MKSIVLVLCLAAASSVHAQVYTSSANRATPPTAQSPIPAALLAGKTVFLSNAGGPSGLFPEPFSGAPDRGYAQFYSALKSWGRFTLVDDPANADLVFQLELTAPIGAAHGSKQYGAADPLPEFHLVIFQRSTHYVLWALTSSIEYAILQKTHDHNFDAALNTLTSDVKALVGANAPTPAGGA